MRKCCRILIGFTICLFLGGCNNTFRLESDLENVEQRDYATLLVVDKGKDGKLYECCVGIAQEKKVGEQGQREEVSTFYVNDFEELSKAYASVKGKSLSLSHLKAIMFVADKETVIETQWYLIEQMDENVDIAKTVPILQIKDKEAFLQYVKDAKEPVGIYLGNLVRMKGKEGDDVPWLSDYIKTLRDGKDLSVYYLEELEEGWCLRCRARIHFSQL